MPPILLSPFVEASSETSLNSQLYRISLDQARSFSRRERIPLSPGCLWSIESGYVRTLTWDTSGTIVGLGIWSSGDVVGRALSQLEPYQIECLTSVTVKAIPFSSCRIDSIVSHLQQVEILLSFANTKQVSTRLLRLLHWLAQRFGISVEQGYLLDLPLSHQCLSEMIGSTRVTVTRMLKELDQAGKVKQLRQCRIFLPMLDHC